MQAPPRVIIKEKEVAPRVGLPQPPSSMKKKGKKPEETPVKIFKGPAGKQVIRKSRPLTLGRNRVLLDESEEETEPQVSSRVQPAEEGGEEKAQEGYEATSYRKISIEVNGERLEKCTQFNDPKVANECAGRVARGRIVKSGRALDQRSLADIRAEQEFVQYITGIGFEWLLEIEMTEVPMVLAQEFFTTFRFQHTAGVLSKSIQFRMFGKKLDMTLTEWSVRLGLYTEKQAEAGAWLSRDMRQPTAINEFDCQAAWETITTKAPPYNATQSMGAWINHPVLRLAQFFLGYNLLGQVNASSPISPTELYLVWCMKEQRKVHLGYWLAHTCHMIAIHPERNLTVCHILGGFLKTSMNIFFEGIAPFPSAPHQMYSTYSASSKRT